MSELNNNKNSASFGYKKVTETEKTSLVDNVFTSVTERYDLMNDLMSFGLHRFWKKYFLLCSNIKKGEKVLDLAAGTGDITKLISNAVGDTGKVVSCDINYAMLSQGRDNLIDAGYMKNIFYVQSDAQSLSFKENSFDHVTMAFGLRNTANISKALESIYKILKPGGSIQVLEFSKAEKTIEKPYDIFLKKVIPFLGKHVAKDEDSYKYLAESIDMHPSQNDLIKIMENSNFENCKFNNLSFGVVSIHKGFKI
jgi:demethylmenaquinone methyltransferase/2-methoxy-6-polyprenyl-1,4-benzoquinol methylase